MIRSKIASAVATGALLLYSFATPAFAATTLEISGNGSDSENQVEIEKKQETTVVQENNAQITNNINASANTGDNEAEDNTGGDVSIDTGDATSRVEVTNQANLNVADLGDCANCNGDVDVEISDNGSDSENEAEIESENKTEVFQRNNADIRNWVEAEAETGDNKAEDNTGGDVSVETGNAETRVGISNHANANVATIGNGDESEVSLRISDNGSDSENEIELESENSILLVQENNADIRNWVEAEAETGDNKAEDNTGGDVEIDTGDAETRVEIANAVNFNVADIDCCLFDVEAEISDNGSDSENEIEAEWENELEAFQNNCGKDGEYDGVELFLLNENHHGHRGCEIANNVEAEAETGDNEAEDNTNGDDVEVSTGDAETSVEATTSANVNLFGQDLDFDFDFNLDELEDLISQILDDININT